MPSVSMYMLTVYSMRILSVLIVSIHIQLHILYLQRTPFIVYELGVAFLATAS